MFMSIFKSYIGYGDSRYEANVDSMLNYIASTDYGSLEGEPLELFNKTSNKCLIWQTSKTSISVGGFILDLKEIDSLASLLKGIRTIVNKIDYSELCVLINWINTIKGTMEIKLPLPVLAQMDLIEFSGDVYIVTNAVNGFKIVVTKDGLGVFRVFDKVALLYKVENDVTEVEALISLKGVRLNE